MRLTLGAAPEPDIAIAVGPDVGPMTTESMYGDTLVCPAGTTFDTNTGLCAGTPTPKAAVCPLGVDVTGYGGDAGCVCPPGYSLGTNNQCQKGAGGFFANISPTTLAIAGVSVIAIVLMSMSRGRR